MDASDTTDLYLRAIVAQAPVYLMAMNREGRFVRFEGDIGSRLGIDTKQAIGQSAFDYFQDVPGRTETLRRALAGEAIPHFEMCTGDVCLDVSYTPVRDADGQVDGVVAIGFDVTERRRAEQAAQDAERQLRAVIDASPEWIFVKDPEHRYVLVNQAFAQSVGSTPEQMVGRRDSEFFPPVLVKGDPTDGVVGFHQDDHAVLEGRSIQHLRQRGTVEGHEFIVDEFKEPLLNAAGEVVGIAGFAQDVTRRELAIESLSANHARLEAAQRTAHLGDWTLNPVTFEFEGSDETFRIYEVEREQFDGRFRTFFSRIHPGDVDTVRAAFGGEQGGSRLTPLPHRLRMPDGRVKWVESRWASNSADGFVHGTVQDVTEQVLLREAAERSTRQLASIVDVSPLPIVIIDEQGTILVANPVTERTFGWPEGGLAQQPVTVLMADVTPGEHDRYLRHYIETGLPSTPGGLVINRTRVVRGRRRDGTEFPAELTVAEIPLSGGERQFVGIVADRTEAVAKEQQLIRMQKLDAIGTLVAGVAHDFNNLLTAILGGIEMASVQPDEPRWSQLSREAAERAVDLVKRLLTFSRDEEPRRDLVSPGVVVDSVMSLAGETIDRRIWLAADVAEGLPEFFVDRRQIEQVLLNLLINARDAVLQRAEEAGDGFQPTVQLAVRVTESGGASGIMFTVRDNGAGMSPQVRERVFDPFFTTKPTGKGTGLGLSIVNGIVASHDGQVDVVSEVGAGTSFMVWLPLVPAGSGLPEPVEPAREPDAARPARRPRVLLVDDETMVGEVAQAYLSAAGFEVVLRHHGSEALAVAASDPFDVAVVDLNMPGMDGWALMAALHQQHPGMPVVVASGFAAESEVAAYGGAGLVHKPYSREQIARAVQQAISGSVLV